MINTSTFTFLRQLKKNNNKVWFDQNKNAYHLAKENYLQLAAAAQAIIAEQHPHWATTETKNTLFRINRDVRFSKDKSPYKPHFGAAFTPTGKKDSGIGYYLHVEPGNCFVAGGAWMPDAKYLKNIRQEIDYQYSEWQSIVAYKKFVALFGALDSEAKLQRVPKGYVPNHPAAEYLKLKAYTVSAKIPDQVLQSKEAGKELPTYYIVMKPLIDFLEKAKDG